MNNAELLSSVRDLVLMHGIKEFNSAAVGGTSPVDSHDPSPPRPVDSSNPLNYTFILPDITHYPDAEFRAFLHKDLIETTTLVSLEQAGR